MVEPSTSGRVPVRTEALCAAWEGIRRKGYAVVRDIDLGLAASLHGHISTQYFSEGALEADHVEVHKDRDRSRDVLRYEWHADDVVLSEHDTVTIENRSGYVGVRSHKRVELLADTAMAEWARAVLPLVPPPYRHPAGTFGVNFFRTRTAVVSGPHRDGEEFCLVYVVAKLGAGATTLLHPADNPDFVELQYTLTPGEMLFFSDERYLHDVTPLRSVGNQPCHRDAIVCTVDYPDTYRV
jgi:hypothetical protein